MIFKVTEEEPMRAESRTQEQMALVPGKGGGGLQARGTCTSCEHGRHPCNEWRPGPWASGRQAQSEATAHPTSAPRSSCFHTPEVLNSSNNWKHLEGSLKPNGRTPPQFLIQKTWEGTQHSASPRDPPRLLLPEPLSDSRHAETRAGRHSAQGPVCSSFSQWAPVKLELALSVPRGHKQMCPRRTLSPRAHQTQGDSRGEQLPRSPSPLTPRAGVTYGRHEI